MCCGVWFEGWKLGSVTVGVDSQTARRRSPMLARRFKSAEVTFFFCGIQKTSVVRIPYLAILYGYWK